MVPAVVEGRCGGGPITPRRIQLSRRKGWQLPFFSRSVARPGFWGNPFLVENWGAEMAVALHRWAMLGQWGRVNKAWKRKTGLAIGAYTLLGLQAYFADARRRLPELRGLSLGCWCRLGDDVPCHAQTLLTLANAPEAAHAHD